jgi:hypothetical protein
VQYLGLEHVGFVYGISREKQEVVSPACGGGLKERDQKTLESIRQNDLLG